MFASASQRAIEQIDERARRRGSGGPERRRIPRRGYPLGSAHPRQVELIPGVRGESVQEEGSGSPVSFPKRVGMIERRVHRCERERRSAVIERYPIDGGDDLFHLGQVVPNRRDRSKCCRTFPDVDGSDVSGPLVQILENVLVK